MKKQLNVAFSRVRRFYNIKIKVKNTDSYGEIVEKTGAYTKNIGFKEILDRLNSINIYINV